MGYSLPNSISHELPRARGERTPNPQTGVLTARVGQRHYSPGLGRWTSRDPIGELSFRLRADRRAVSRTGIDQKDLYGAFANDPIGVYDFLGLWGRAPGPGEVNTRCIVQSDRSSICEEACRDKKDYYKGKPTTGAWARTICRRGQKCDCYYPENFKESPPDDDVLICAWLHEQYHVRDPNITCNPDLPGNSAPIYLVPQFETECAAWREVADCFENLDSSKKGGSEVWEAYQGWKANCEKAGLW